jgi:hypothetical protein
MFAGGKGWYSLQFQTQKERFITQCNLPKAKHFNPTACSFCERKGEWPTDYEVVIDHQGGVFMDFLKKIIAYIPGCQALYDEQFRTQLSVRLALEKSLLPMLQKIVPMDEDSMEFSVEFAGMHATSGADGGLTAEGLDTLGGHALHAVLAFVVNGEEPGLGIDLTKFTTFNHFEEYISPKFLAKVVAIFMKTGSSTLLHHIMYFPLLKNNRLMKMFVSCLPNLL